MTIPISKIVSKIRRIQFQSTQLAQDVLAGAYLSAFKGRGMEFEDVREYQEGDEVRSIDWNVTARMNRPYVKNFREERDLTVILLVDVSGSARFGERYGTKSDLIAEIGALLAFSAIRNNDRVGLILFSNIIEKYVSPRSGIRHVLRVIRELLVFKPTQSGSDLKAALAFLGKVHKRSTICFVISDFFYPLSEHDLKITAQQHDLIGISVTDPFEKAFPDLGLIHMTDLETEKSYLVDSSAPEARDQFRKSADEHLSQLKHILNKVNAGYIDIRTDKPYLTALRQFFALRKLRKR